MALECNVIRVGRFNEWEVMYEDPAYRAKVHERVRGSVEI